MLREPKKYAYSTVDRRESVRSGVMRWRWQRALVSSERTSVMALMTQRTQAGVLGMAAGISEQWKDSSENGGQ